MMIGLTSLSFFFQSEPPPSHAKREDLVKSKIFDINSFDDDEADPEKRNANVKNLLLQSSHRSSTSF